MASVSDTANNKEISEKLQKYLASKKYEVTDYVGSEAAGTFTYECSMDDMPFVAKLGVVTEGEGGDSRVNDLKNEVDVVEKLWKEYPEGEAKSFLLPPGPETIFDEDYEGLKIYGYARFYIEGSCLGWELRDGTQNFGDWVDTYVNLVKEIDSLPDMDLPRTKEKEGFDYKKKIIEGTEKWEKGLLELIRTHNIRTSGGFMDLVSEKAGEIKEFFEKNHVVLGTVHGNLTPENLVYDETNGKKPYLISFTKLSQRYPRFYDVAWVYGWVCAVLGDVTSAMKFWSETSASLNIDQIDYLRNASNQMLLGMAFTYLSNEGKGIKFGEEAFL